MISDPKSKKIGSIFSSLSACSAAGLRPPDAPLLRGTHGGGNAAYRAEDKSAAPGLVPAHGVQSPIP